MDGNVVIPFSEFIDPISRVLLSRNHLDIVVRAARHGLGSACMCCSIESTAVMSWRHVVDRYEKVCWVNSPALQNANEPGRFH